MGVVSVRRTGPRDMESCGSRSLSGWDMRGEKTARRKSTRQIFNIPLQSSFLRCRLGARFRTPCGRSIQAAG